jgi:heat-inducible transcriptional repressor
MAVTMSLVPPISVAELNERSREILSHIVDSFLETGEPIGSRTISRRMGMSLSPATIRNVMADLEDLGVLYAPHTSAGRLPTELGLRLFVHGLLEVGRLTEAERQSIEIKCTAAGRSISRSLEEATTMLAELSHCAGLVLAPKTDSVLRHIEFVSLGPGRVLVVLVTETGIVENRVIDVPMGLPASSLIEATNYLNARLVGRTVEEARQEILAELERERRLLDELTRKVVETGLASHDGGTGTLIVRGRALLLEDVNAAEDLERIRDLFEALERKEALVTLLGATEQAEGVQIFIGGENDLFRHAGCSMIVAPYTDSREQIVGAIGVIGPTRINYARIIPMVDYTAKVVGRLLG